MSHNRYKFNDRQRGNLLILSMFIVIVVGLLGSSLIKIQTGSNSMVTKDVLGTQAWFMAYSGAESALVDLFPLNEDIANIAICSGEIDVSNVVEINNSGCNSAPAVTCERQLVDGISYFRIISTATCGSGVNRVTRAQEVWAKEVLR